MMAGEMEKMEKKKEKSWTYLESVRESGVMMLQINFTHGTRSTSIT